MKLFYEKLKEELAKSIAQILIAAAMVFLTILIPKDVIRSVDLLIWFWLVVILSIICLTLAVYILKQRNKDIFIKELVIWQEKKTENYICPSCKTNGKRSYLKECEDRYVCLNNDCGRQ